MLYQTLISYAFFKELNYAQAYYYIFLINVVINWIDIPVLNI